VSGLRRYFFSALIDFCGLMDVLREKKSQLQARKLEDMQDNGQVSLHVCFADIEAYLPLT
jgi:hypothetical protein